MTHITASRHILYILGHTGGPASLSLIPKKESGETLSVILVQDALSVNSVPADHVYALANDAASSQVPAVGQPICHEEMARMIFEADRVVVL